MELCRITTVPLWFPTAVHYGATQGRVAEQQVAQGPFECCCWHHAVQAPGPGNVIDSRRRFRSRQEPEPLLRERQPRYRFAVGRSPQGRRLVARLALGSTVVAERGKPLQRRFTEEVTDPQGASGQSLLGMPAIEHAGRRKRISSQLKEIRLAIDRAAGQQFVPQTRQGNFSRRRRGRASRGEFCLEQLGQCPSIELACRPSGKLCEHQHPRGNLRGFQVREGKLPQCPFVGDEPRTEFHSQHQVVLQSGMGDCEGGRLQHGGMPLKDLVDFAGGDFHRPPADLFAGPAGHVQFAPLVEPAEIAREKPPPPERLVRRLRVTKVARGDGRPPYGDFPQLSRGNGVALRIENRQVGPNRGSDAPR